MDTVRGTAFLQFGDLLAERGAALRSHLAPHRIDLSVVGNYEKKFSYKSLVQIFEGSAHALAMPELGLELATRQQSTLLGPLQHLAQTAPTAGEGLAAVVRYMHLYSPSILFRLERRNGCTLLCFDNTLPCIEEIPQIVEKSLLHGKLMMAELLGTPFQPTTVLLRHPPQAELSVYRRYFDCPVLFGQDHNALVIAQRDLQRPCARHDALLHSIVRFYLEAHSDAGEKLGFAVERHIHALLPKQRCSLEQVAQLLDLHPRTLQRRLANDGIDFEEHVDQIRRHRAEQLLGHSDLSIARIAQELGYRRTTSFCRAHHRWFGMAPIEHRRALKH
ncbi:AraC family transcriptional regulator [Pseudomonas nicosulfuronedens]|uniref:AraC family transcriptional regulator n=1 Tax=Pseudomonas nicosulfuronedens TaxID=2571105 RepID=A0A5R9RC70_9PSED|nr:AraC family transcriptional regulator [Pseudomonas nicosulfuronedens]MDH1011125.1 AraC family transcriptional regulator [Pseudomonas nicosulfuronedens]MDH1981156.1 AraC family transcriptional regulator [Pseudomonas nicosulfuronedens]MDH2026895.1 AraC family transcriptional regulator [Pseudomonas nicosulfuronedens]TLX79588.1 AraC family transcriptional regulator [Pseudomonas nicosulfuronedens]